MQRFIAFPRTVYRADPAWVPPMRSDLAHRLDPTRNPFYATARRELFLARRAGAVVGTVAAIVDDARNTAAGEAVGYFGFFEAVDDGEVVGALFEAATRWLVRAGASTVRGPINGSSADEMGLLVEGFETRPALWQGHHRPYYRRRLEALGLRRFDDLLAYELTYRDIGGSLDNLPRALPRAADRARRAGATVRSPTRDSWLRDVVTAHDLYVRSHRHLPGHSGMSLAEFTSIAERMRRLIDLDLTLLVELDGEPVGFAIAVPDLNEALARHGSGRTPWRALALLRGLRRVDSVSVKLLGVLPEHRNRGLGPLLCDELSRRIVAAGYRRCEMSLVSERNTPMTSLLDRLHARVYRRYRVYEAPLPAR